MNAAMPPSVQHALCLDMSLSLDAMANVEARLGNRAAAFRLRTSAALHRIEAKEIEIREARKAAIRKSSDGRDSLPPAEAQLSLPL